MRWQAGPLNVRGLHCPFAARSGCEVHTASGKAGYALATKGQLLPKRIHQHVLIGQGSTSKAVCDRLHPMAKDVCMPERSAEPVNHVARFKCLLVANSISASHGGLPSSKLGEHVQGRSHGATASITAQALKTAAACPAARPSASTASLVTLAVSDAALPAGRTFDQRFARQVDRRLQQHDERTIDRE